MPIDLEGPELVQLVELLKRFVAQHSQTQPRQMTRDKWINHQRITLECLGFEFYCQFGRELRRLRVRQGLELAAVAEQLGVSRNWLTRMECGHRQMPVWQMALAAFVFNQNLMTMISRTLEQCLKLREGSAFEKRLGSTRYE